MNNVIMACILTAITFSAQASNIMINSKYSGITEELDAFGNNQGPIKEIEYGGVFNISFKCDRITVNTASKYTSYDGFVYPADVAMKFDGGEVVKANNAKYSTYKYGSDIINDDRYYTFKLTEKMIQLMKASNSVTIGMKAKHYDKWDYKTMELLGFAKAYTSMCD